MFNLKIDITDEMIDEYWRDGVLCLRGVAEADWIESLREGVELSIAAPGHLGKVHTPKGGSGRFFVDSFMGRRIEAFRRFVFESAAPGIAARLLGSDSIRFMHDHLLVKEPGTAERTPWHQDRPYYPVRNGQVCTMWFPLDQVTQDSGAVEYIAGSHRWGKVFTPKPVTDASAEQWAEAKHEALPDFGSQRDQHRFLSWDTNPGDCIIHDSLTVHGAGGNSRGDRRRRALALRYADPAVLYDPKPGTTDFGEDPGIAAGAPLDGRLFPLVPVAA